MRGLFTYLTLGRAVYRLLRERFPEVDDVPLDDVLVVVTELLTTPATLDEAMVCAEVVPGHLAPTRAGTTDYRLVVRLPPPEGEA
ncbi:MAG TPA: hypothetical protein VKE26_26155 [Xanthobacteraceae bacterium]|nr:hypothetical protein [Xanthobacteraceae bacterium]